MLHRKPVEEDSYSNRRLLSCTSDICNQSAAKGGLISIIKTQQHGTSSFWTFCRTMRRKTFGMKIHYLTLMRLIFNLSICIAQLLGLISLRVVKTACS